MKNERIGLLLVNLLLALASVFFFSPAPAQQLPTFFNPDPAYWYGQYLVEQARADGLERSGKTAITGLQASLKLANQRLAKQDTTIAILTTDRNTETERANQAEKQLAICEADKPKTWAGKQLAHLGTGLKWVGGATLVYLGLKTAL
ncbi:hypothetical protein GO755_30325 [Spirosoma sp. HMF4905]|uniref:DUF5667 domain-containing protein n=1 Tax=Spirosoma arboris TaxID=2682092 RepID=A0A7K1SKN3_9BACT|nr:hypothetical protein [Spirosoma arboris]MVM34367.1 hypothetical protein [Spirosoma arboris]